MITSDLNPTIRCTNARLQFRPKLHKEIGTEVAPSWGGPQPCLMLFWSFQLWEKLQLQHLTHHGWHNMLLEQAAGSWGDTFITGSSLVFAEVANSAVSLRNFTVSVRHPTGKS